eukprot:5949897-Pleurochrysis_carterae.AAC.1
MRGLGEKCSSCHAPVRRGASRTEASGSTLRKESAQSRSARLPAHNVAFACHLHLSGVKGLGCMSDAAISERTRSRHAPQVSVLQRALAQNPKSERLQLALLQAREEPTRACCPLQSVHSAVVRSPQAVDGFWSAEDVAKAWEGALERMPGATCDARVCNHAVFSAARAQHVKRS